MVSFLLNLDLRRVTQRRFRIGIDDFGIPQKINNLWIFAEIFRNFEGKKVFVIFNATPKSRIPIRNRRLGTLLRSKFDKKHQIGKLRLSAFQRLKNQRLRTSPSKVMAISQSYKTFIKFIRNHKIRKILSFYLPESKNVF